MMILAMDTSSGACSVALQQDDRLLCEVYFNNGNTHAEHVMLALDDCLARANVGIDQVGLLACTIGPGSFTGLRIGISTAKAMAQSLEIPCVGVDTLHALSENIVDDDAIVCPLLDARRQEVYSAAYTNGKNIIPTMPRGLEDYLELLGQKQPKRCVFLGDGALAYRKQIEEQMGGMAVFAPIQLMHQRASAVAAIAAKTPKGDYLDAVTLMPNYHRLSQAERLRGKSDG